MLSRGGRGRPTAVYFVVSFGCGGISFFVSFLFLRTHTACCTCEATLPHLPLHYYQNKLLALSPFLAESGCGGKGFPIVLSVDILHTWYGL